MSASPQAHGASTAATTLRGSHRYLYRKKVLTAQVIYVDRQANGRSGIYRHICVCVAAPKKVTYDAESVGAQCVKTRQIVHSHDQNASDFTALMLWNSLPYLAKNVKTAGLPRHANEKAIPACLSRERLAFW